MDLAKEKFDSMSISECQKFILNKTRNLNVAQCKQFWKEFNRLFASKSDNKVDPLHSNGDNIATDLNEKEDIPFDSFFAGRHLIEKSPDFDDVFYDHVNRVNNTISEADGEHDTGQQHLLYEESNNILSSEITTGEVLNFCKKYETSDKSFDNHGFHPIMLRHLGVRAV